MAHVLKTIACASNRGENVKNIVVVLNNVKLGNIVNINLDQRDVHAFSVKNHVHVLRRGNVTLIYANANVIEILERLN